MYKSTLVKQRQKEEAHLPGKVRSPLPIKMLAILVFCFGLLAFFGSLFLWGEGLIFQFPKGVDYSFPIADLLIHAPAAMIASIGLWKLKRYGYVAAQFVAGFYIYVSVEIFVKVAQGGPPYALEIVGPQVLAVLVALGLVFYLWRVQDLFHFKQVL